MKEKKEKLKVKDRRESKFIGPIITPLNRTQYFDNYKNHWKDSNKDENLSNEEKEYMSEIFAKNEIEREKKHLRAYLKGKSTYRYMRDVYPVMTKKYIEAYTKQFNKN